jgi:regulator of sigma D
MKDKINYFTSRKDEIGTKKIVQRLSDFCLELIEKLSNGDEKIKEQLIKKMVEEVIKYSEKENFIGAE